MVDAPDDDAGVRSGVSVEFEGELGGADEFGFGGFGVAPGAIGEEFFGNFGRDGNHQN